MDQLPVLYILIIRYNTGGYYCCFILDRFWQMCEQNDVCKKSHRE